MLLIGKENKEFKLRIHTGFESKNSFTKFLVFPFRDSSISAAQRARSEEPKSKKIRKKIRNLAKKRENLKNDKEKFEEFQRENQFFGLVEEIVEYRMQVENQAAVLIQSRFRGYYYRKIYIQKLVDIGRETTKRLVKEMENFVNELFTENMGIRSAVVIQKHWRRVLCQRVLRKSLADIKAKILKENNCSLPIQTRFRQFLSRFAVEKKNKEKIIESRLEYLKKKQYARKILRALIRLAVKARLEREEKKRILTANSRKKALSKMKKIRPFMKKSRNVLDQICKANKDSQSTGFFNSFSALKQIRNFNLSEHSQLQTESSTIRRRSVNVKRSAPRVQSAQQISNREEKKLKELEQVKSSEMKYNVCKDLPPAPDFLHILGKSRKANWRVLGSNNADDGVKGSGKTSTRFTRSPSPNMIVPHKDGSSGLSNRLDYY